MLPALHRALGVEMIRDGGSFAASFEDEGARRYILFTRLKITDRGATAQERTGYDAPVLIDCDPSKRPADTEHKHYGDLSGPKVSVSWQQARIFMALTKLLPDDLPEWRRTWLESMNYVVANDGALPPSMDAIMRVKRPPATLLHLGLNSDRFAPLHLYRTNAALYPVSSTVNNLLGCVLSGNIEPMPALITRCRSAISQLLAPSTSLRDEYILLVESYLKSVEAEYQALD